MTSFILYMYRLTDGRVRRAMLLVGSRHAAAAAASRAPGCMRVRRMARKHTTEHSTHVCRYQYGPIGWRNSFLAISASVRLSMCSRMGSTAAIAT